MSSDQQNISTSAAPPKAAGRVLAAVRPDVAAILRRLLDEPLRSSAALEASVRAHLTELDAAAHAHEFIDLETFVLAEDADGDTSSVIGFDDDCEVVAPVARETLGRRAD